MFENQSLQNHKIRQLMCDIPTDMLWSVDCGSLRSTLRRPNRLWTHLVKAHKASEPLSSQSVATNKLDSSFPVFQRVSPLSGQLISGVCGVDDAWVRGMTN